MIGTFIHRANIVVWFVPLSFVVAAAYVLASPIIAIGMVWDGAKRHWNS